MQGVEFVAAVDSNKATLVLLHGWGYHRHAFPASLLDGLQERFQLVLVDLPGHGEARAIDGADAAGTQLDNWLAELMAVLPSQFALLGWSLGGQIALRITAQYPQRVSSLVMLASNLSFVQHDDWPHAMPVATLTSFRDAYGRLPSKTLQRFCALQAQGAQQADMLKTLRSYIQVSADAGQQAGLYWLAMLDGRQAWQQLACPAMAVLAAADALLPAAVIDDMRQLNSKAQVQLVAACHALPFDVDLQPILDSFWEVSDEQLAKC